MEDRELLELAAKALDDPKLFANTTGAPWQYWIGFCEEMQCDVTRLWNPLEDDGDALRLAADLCLNIEWFPGQKFVQACRFGMGEIIGWVDESGRSGSLRRAITVAAAKIGKAMQEQH